MMDTTTTLSFTCIAIRKVLSGSQMPRDPARRW